MLATFLLAATMTPLAELHDLVGAWKCTYRAGAALLAYDATWTYDLDGRAIRETASWAGGDEELVAYDPQRGGWTAVVLDDHGNATTMRATGRDPNHIAYHSISATEYALHATVRSGGKATTSVDTCVRGPR
jgi:hypothetical protein